MNDDQNNTSEVQEQLEPKFQYILDENGNLAEISKEQCLPVEQPIKVRLENAFEVFVQVPDAPNYYISNCGRLINNINRKDKSTFYHHKTGYCHFTVFEIDSDGSRYKRDYYTDELVAITFLKQPYGRFKIWHKDGNIDNDWYKNLMYVTDGDLRRLKNGEITWRDLDYRQEYIEYENRASAAAYIVYNGIKTRCKNSEATESIHACYNDTAMCDEWNENPKSFVKWYLENYYACDGELMAVDKDLFGNGFNVYSPENCCILPQSLNTMLANAKQHYRGRKDENGILPYGVKYSGKRKKYYSEIALTDTDNKRIRLADWDTPEEAFAEYKKMKEADIKTMTAKYRDKIPEYIYKKLLTVEVQPY